MFKALHHSPGDKKQEVAESILKFFPGFEAFKLPPPSSDPDVVQNLNDESNFSEINKSFLKGVKEFKQLLHSTLTPKHSLNEGEFVTGEGKHEKKGRPQDRSFIFVAILCRSWPSCS